MMGQVEGCDGAGTGSGRWRAVMGQVEGCCRAGAGL